MNTTKWILPLILALVTGIMGGAGTAIYQHELAILKNARHIERLQVKDYRQHRDSLRTIVRVLSEMVGQLEVAVEIDPEVFGPNTGLILKSRESLLEHAERRLENYVEENKHGGRDD